MGLPKFKREKIGPAAVDALFIGYTYQNTACQFNIKGTNDSYKHGNIIEARDAKFFENIFPMKIASHDHHIPHEVSHKRHACSSSIVLRRSKRIRKKADFGLDFITTFLVEYNMLNEVYVSTYIIEEDPKIFEEAMKP